MKDGKKRNFRANAGIFFKVLKYLRAYRIFFILSLLFTAASVALTLYVPILIGRAIDKAIGAGNVDLQGIAEILITVGIAVVITAVLQWLINVFNNRMSYGIVRNIRHDAFVRIQH